MMTSRAAKPSGLPWWALIATLAIGVAAGHLLAGSARTPDAAPSSRAEEGRDPSGVVPSDRTKPRVDVPVGRQASTDVLRSLLDTTTPLEQSAAEGILLPDWMTGAGEPPAETVLLEERAHGFSWMVSVGPRPNDDSMWEEEIGSGGAVFKAHGALGRQFGWGYLFRAVEVSRSRARLRVRDEVLCRAYADGDSRWLFVRLS